MNKAIKADQNENISEACELYSEAIKYFISAIYCKFNDCRHFLFITLLNSSLHFKKIVF